MPSAVMGGRLRLPARARPRRRHRRSGAAGCTGSQKAIVVPRPPALAAPRSARRGPRSTAADRQAEARPGRLLVAGANAIEHVEHGVARFGRNAGPSSLTLTLTRSPSSAAPISIRRRRRILGGVVENVDQHLLDEDRVDVEERQVLRDLHLDFQRGERLAICLSARPTISRRSTHSRFGCSAP